LDPGNTPTTRATTRTTEQRSTLMISRLKTPPPTDTERDDSSPRGRERADVTDVRSQTLLRRDRSAHRRHAWLYEDLLN
jgi:hypothetical protein